MICGYIDESYDGKKTPEIFTLSCTLATGEDWAFIEVAWLWVIEMKNAELLAAGRKPISRYHATNCNARKGDFSGWSRDERDRFVLDLFEVFRLFHTASVSLTMSARDIVEVWPENQDVPVDFAYHIMVQLLMIEIGKRMPLFPNGGKIALIYERSDFGPSLLRGFNKIMDDPTFRFASTFTTCKPMGWESCVPLQLADLVAYESFKHIERRRDEKEMRPSLAALLAMPTFRGVAKHMTRANLVSLRGRHEAALVRKASQESNQRAEPVTTSSSTRQGDKLLI